MPMLHKAIYRYENVSLQTTCVCIDNTFLAWQEAAKVFFLSMVKQKSNQWFLVGNFFLIQFFWKGII